MLNNRTLSISVRNVTALMTGTALAQLISLLLTPVLTRLFSPDDFGVVALYLSVSAILVAISTARYEVAIMLPKSDIAAFNIVALSVVIALVVSLATIIIVFLVRSYVSWSSAMATLGNWIYLVPITVLIGGVYQALYYWLNREKFYVRMGVVSIGQSATNAAGAVGFGLIGMNAAGLIIANLLGQACAVVILLFSAAKRIASLRSHLSRKRMSTMFQRHKAMLQFGTPALMVSAFAQQSLFLLTAIYIGATTLGLFSIINRIVGVPSSILGNALGQVFYQEISECPIKESFRPILRFTKRLFVASALVYASLYFVLGFLFVPLFGPAWGEAQQYLGYFVLVSYFSFVFSPLSVLFNYYEVQHVNLVWQCAWAISNILVFVVYGLCDIGIHMLLTIYTVKQCALYMMGIAGFLIVASRRAAL